MVYRKRPQRLFSQDVRPLADALLTARRQVLTARAALPWGCSHDHALQSVVAAIDALAVMLRALDGDLWSMDSALSDAMRSPARSNRPSTLENPYLLMSDLRTLREALRSAQDRVAVGGPMYAALEMVAASTAMAAALLTGDPDYWIDAATSSTAAHRSTAHVKQAKERGD